MRSFSGEILDNLVKTSNPYQVYSVFQEYFGEDKVDYYVETNSGNTIGSIHLPSMLDATLPENLRGKINLVNSEEFYEYVCKEGAAINSFLWKQFDIKFFILVHFPTVYIANEYGQKHLIRDLYAQISILSTGKPNQSFKLNRSTYTKDEILSKYMHSHVPSIELNNLSNFRPCCLGSGPINSTITSLNIEFDLNIWRLFCFELEKYVHVESIAGGPYKRIERIGLSDSVSSNFDSFRVLNPSKNKDIVPSKQGFRDDVFRYILNNFKFPITYNKKGYTLGMAFIDYNIAVSKLAVKYYNELVSKGEITAGTYEGYLELFEDYLVTDTTIGRLDSRPLESTSLNGNPLFMFKGEMVTLKIIESTELENKEVTLLKLEYAEMILLKVLAFININYEKKRKPSSVKSIRIF